MSVPPSKKTVEAIIIVFFRPMRSAKGKAISAPKKHPACSLSVLHDTKVDSIETDLKCGDDVALYCVTVAFGDIIHAKVANEGSESHSPADDGCVIAHYSRVRCLHPHYFTETY